ncbi:MAG: rhodanese-like domain-containing protein [Elainellaceae cyanobacterium]
MRLFGLIPTPPPLRPKSNVYDLKARLDWGEPALTIIDVRDRSEFSTAHIQGAVSIPAFELVGAALAHLELERDLYVYGYTDEETAIAAAQLRAAGFLNVSELRGGMPAWKAVGFPVETATLFAA